MIWRDWISSMQPASSSVEAHHCDGITIDPWDNNVDLCTPVPVPFEFAQETELTHLRADMLNGRLRYRSPIDDTGYTLPFLIAIGMHVLATIAE